MGSIGNVNPASYYDETEVRYAPHETLLIKVLRACGVKKDMQYLMFGGYIVGKMTCCIRYLRSGSSFVRVRTQSRRQARLGFRIQGSHVCVFLCGPATCFLIFSAASSILFLV